MVAKSIATQTIDELGGPRSVLVRQRRDHAELDRLLQAIDHADRTQRQELLTRLCRLVFPHAFAEESVLWPAIRRVLPDGEHLTLTIEREHQEINELFTELERTAPESDRHRQVWDRIAGLLRQDVRDEEDQLLPTLQEVVTGQQLARMGLAWELVRRIAPTRPHPVVARRPPGNVAAALPLTVIDRLRDRLDRTARRTGGVVGAMAVGLSANLARVAGVVEHIPPLTRGEDPSTHHRQ